MRDRTECQRCRVCSQEKPCGVCSAWSTADWRYFTACRIVWHASHLAGTWSPTEKLLHIYLTELLTIQGALQHYKNRVIYCTVLIKTDNSTGGSYRNRQGGTHSPSLCMHTWELPRWCIPHWTLLRVHLP